MQTLEEIEKHADAAEQAVITAQMALQNLKEPIFKAPTFLVAGTGRTDLHSVSFEENDAAKILGCKWDGKKKTWYYPSTSIPAHIVYLKNCSEGGKDAMLAEVARRQIVLKDAKAEHEQKVTQWRNARIDAENALTRAKSEYAKAEKAAIEAQRAARKAKTA